MVERFLGAQDVAVERWSKTGTKTANVRPAVMSLSVHPDGGEALVLRFLLREGEGGARPRDVLRGILHVDERIVNRLRLRKLDSFVEAGGALASADLRT
jgi:hypothetical protein